MADSKVIAVFGATGQAGGRCRQVPGSEACGVQRPGECPKAEWGKAAGAALRREGRGGRVFLVCWCAHDQRALAAYFENFLTAWKPVKAPGGDHYTLALPMGNVPMDGISVADTGAIVSSIFNSPEEFLGKAVGLSAETLTVQQYADVLSKILGKEVQDAKITPEAYEKLGFPGAEELANMCRFYQMKPDRDVKLTHRLNPKVKSFSQFILENQGAFKDM